MWQVLPQPIQGVIVSFLTKPEEFLVGRLVTKSWRNLLCEYLEEIIGSTKGYHINASFILLFSRIRRISLEYPIVVDHEKEIIALAQHKYFNHGNLDVASSFFHFNTRVRMFSDSYIKKDHAEPPFFTIFSNTGSISISGSCLELKNLSITYSRTCFESLNKCFLFESCISDVKSYYCCRHLTSIIRFTILFKNKLVAWPSCYLDIFIHDIMQIPTITHYDVSYSWLTTQTYSAFIQDLLLKLQGYVFPKVRQFFPILATRDHLKVVKNVFPNLEVLHLSLTSLMESNNILEIAAELLEYPKIIFVNDTFNQGNTPDFFPDITTVPSEWLCHNLDS